MEDNGNSTLFVDNTFKVDKELYELDKIEREICEKKFAEILW